MDDGRQMRVVVIVDVSGEAVCERAELGVGPLGASDDRNDRRPAVRSRDAQDDLNALVTARADRDGEDVEERTLRFVRDGGWQIGRLKGRDRLGDPTGYRARRGGRCHRDVLGAGVIGGNDINGRGGGGEASGSRLSNAGSARSTLSVVVPPVLVIYPRTM